MSAVFTVTCVPCGLVTGTWETRAPLRRFRVTERCASRHSVTPGRPTVVCHCLYPCFHAVEAPPLLSRHRHRFAWSSKTLSIREVSLPSFLDIGGVVSKKLSDQICERLLIFLRHLKATRGGQNLDGIGKIVRGFRWPQKSAEVVWVGNNGRYGAARVYRESKESMTVFLR